MNHVAEQHLARAKEYVARGEEFYRKAAEEIIAAQKADPTLSNRAIGEWFGYGESWVSDVVARVTNPRGREEARRKQDEASNRAKAKRVLSEAAPEQIAEQFLSDPVIREKVYEAQNLTSAGYEQRGRQAAERSEKKFREDVGEEVADGLAYQDQLRQAEAELFRARRGLLESLRILNTAGTSDIPDSWREEFLRTTDDLATKLGFLRTLLTGANDEDLAGLLAEEA